MLQLDPALDDRPRQVLMPTRATARPFEAELFRQIIESMNQTLKAQLDHERHEGRTPAGVCARSLQ